MSDDAARWIDAPGINRYMAEREHVNGDRRCRACRELNSPARMECLKCGTPMPPTEKPQS